MHRGRRCPSNARISNSCALKYCAAVSKMTTPATAAINFIMRLKPPGIPSKGVSSEDLYEIDKRHSAFLRVVGVVHDSDGCVRRRLSPESLSGNRP